jgi:hypothetical protein
MISHAHKTLFVHIPKCGGQSIENMFLSDLGLGRKDKSRLLLRKRRGDERGPAKLGHLTASDYIRLGFIDHNSFDSYYRFSVVRNPFDRLRSAYNYLGFRELITFSCFVEQVVVEALENRNSLHWFLRPQTDFLLDAEGFLLVNQYFKLEEMSASIDQIIERSRLSVRELPHSNNSSAISRASRFMRALKLLLKEKISLTEVLKKDELGCDIKLRARIELLYRKDYEQFGY